MAITYKMWPGLVKQGMRVHKIWLYLHTFMAHNLFYWSPMAMKFPTIIKYVMGYIIQVTEYKYSVPVLRNDLLCDKV